MFSTGRVTSTLPLDYDLSDSDATATHPRQPPRGARRRDPTLAPEDVLFRRIGAPVRFAEKDIYRAHEALPNEGRDVLPDSDMVKAMHNYASHFYTALAASARERKDDRCASRGGSRSRRKDENETRKGKGKGKGNIDEQSMDETALLAFGILLEEVGREILGKKGDLVFTEGVEVDDEGETVDGDLGPIGFLDARRWEQQQGSRKTRRSKWGENRLGWGQYYTIVRCVEVNKRRQGGKGSYDYWST